MSNRNLYDGNSGAGDHSLPFQHGPTIGWYDNETRSKLYSITVRVRAASLAIQPVGTPGPLGGWQVEVSEPTHVGAGVLEFTYTYAYLPPPRKCGETTVWNYQEIRSGKLLEIPLTTSALVHYSYFHTFDPTTIPQLRAYKIIEIDGIFYRFGAVSSGDLILAEDSRMRLWRGTIYERTAVYVSRRALTTV